MGCLAALFQLEQVEVVTVPTTQAVLHENGEYGKQAEPGNMALTVRNHDGRGQQRAEGAARIAANLEGRLRQAIATA